VDSFFCASLKQLERSLALLETQAAATRALRAKDLAQRRAEIAAERELAAVNRRQQLDHPDGGIVQRLLQRSRRFSTSQRRTKSTAQSGHGGDFSTGDGVPTPLNLTSSFRISTNLDQSTEDDQFSPPPPPAKPGNLPNNWGEALDPVSGKPYFTNSATGAVTWERPATDHATLPAASAKSVKSESPKQIHSSPLERAATESKFDLRASLGSMVRGSVGGGEEDTPTVTEVLELLSAKRAYDDLYKRANMLETFALLNHTAIVKLILHHNEVLACVEDTHGAASASRLGEGSGIGMSSFLEGDAMRASKAGLNRRASTKGIVSGGGVSFGPSVGTGGVTESGLERRDSGVAGDVFGTVNPLSQLATSLPSVQIISLLLDTTAFGPREHGCSQKLDLFKGRLSALYAEVGLCAFRLLRLTWPSCDGPAAALICLRVSFLRGGRCSAADLWSWPAQSCSSGAATSVARPTTAPSASASASARAS